MNGSLSVNNKRRVNGILLLDKPLHLSSNAALQKVKRLFCAKKAGHTGSLDPLATGMLPICFGQATKFCEYLLQANKSYLVGAQLGKRTTTGDTEGEVVATRDVPDISPAQLDKYLDHFRGKIEQVPSMYSALKYQGKPYYEYARQGIEIERKSRSLFIEDFSVLEQRQDYLCARVTCSKGTYIRTLIDDLGELMGCGAHVVQLRRVSVGEFKASQMVDLPDIERKVQTGGVSEIDSYILPLSVAVSHFPRVNVKADQALLLQNGRRIRISEPAVKLVAVFDAQDALLGVAEISPDGFLIPKKLLS